MSIRSLSLTSCAFVTRGQIHVTPTQLSPFWRYVPRSSHDQPLLVRTLSTGGGIHPLLSTSTRRSHLGTSVSGLSLLNVSTPQWSGTVAIYFGVCVFTARDTAAVRSVSTDVRFYTVHVYSLNLVRTLRADLSGLLIILFGELLPSGLELVIYCVKFLVRGAERDRVARAPEREVLY